MFTEIDGRVNQTLEGTSNSKAYKLTQICCVEISNLTASKAWESTQGTFIHENFMNLWQRSWNNTYNQKDSTKDNCLHSHIEIHWKLDAEVIRIGEVFAHQVGPLLRDFPNLIGTISWIELQREEACDEIEVVLLSFAELAVLTRYQIFVRFSNNTKFYQEKHLAMRKDKKVSWSIGVVKKWRRYSWWSANVKFP